MAYEPADKVPNSGWLMVIEPDKPVALGATEVAPATADAAPAVISVEAAAEAALAAPEVDTAVTAVAAVHTAATALPAAVAAVVVRVRASSKARGALMVLSLLVVGGLWATVAHLPAATG